MLHRLAVLLIVGFWIAMTGLLVVRELYPEATRLNQVPVSYVTRLCFQHKQASGLSIYDGQKEVGFFNFEPKVKGLNRILLLHGNLTFSLGGLRQHVTWNSELTLGGDGSVSHLNLELDLSDPGQEPGRHLSLQVDYKTQLLTYSLRLGNVRSGGKDADPVVTDQTTVTLDQAGMTKILERVGIDSTLFKQLQMTQEAAATTELDAQESSTTLNGEKMHTYLVSLRISGQTAFEAHVSPLGQILRAKIPLLNLRLAPKDVNP